MKKKLQKLVDDNFSRLDTYEEDELDDHSVFKKSVNDFLDNKVVDFSAESENPSFFLKSHIFPSDCNSNPDIRRKSSTITSKLDFFDSPSEGESSDGHNVTSAKYKKQKRKSTPSIITNYEKFDNEQCIDEMSDDVNDNEETSSEDEKVSKRNKGVKFELQVEDEVDKKVFTDEEVCESTHNGSGSEDDESNEYGSESEIEDDESDSEQVIDSSFMYSKSMRDESSEIEKGMAVKSQLSLWEILLESRIILQRCLVDCNKLPKPDYYGKLWSECSPDDKSSVVECRENVWNLLEKLIHCQDKFRKQCIEFMETESRKKKNDEDAEVDADEIKIKRRKLTEYPKILDESFNEYTQFRNNTIQKWNDRTKIASGKYAKLNFTAFDQTILNQIEQIMSDKKRLIQKTHIRRSQYKIIGEDNENRTVEGNTSENDVEVFDDDDFYHKLLRDFIEKKTANISDPTQLGKKWIQLQSLRSKMKRKIDTKKTKGRKIRLDVHNKLVNFMAPNVLNRWQDTAINELYSSVFGKNLIHE